jgi:hypothetical protein
VPRAAQWAGEDEPVTDSTSTDWSPADNPHAIALSEAQWWRWAVQLAALRLQDPDDQRLAWPSSRQIDARQLIFALRQLLSAAQLADLAMEARGVDTGARDALAQARREFEDALPGIKDMRDALMHFEDWSRGEGKSGPQRHRRDAGEALRDIAREYWGFGYDPNAGTVSLGPYTIYVDTAARAAKDLSWAVYMASRTVDQANAAALLDTTAAVLSTAGISCGPTPEASLWVRVKDDSRVWLSILTAGVDEQDQRELAQQVVNALTTGGLHLVSIRQGEDLDTVEHLVRGEALFVEPVAASGIKHRVSEPGDRARISSV